MKTCKQCGNEFEPKSAKAVFCSDNCRIKSHRAMDGGATVGSPVPAPEKEKKAHCDQCVTFESGIHWCQNKECGCFETKEEQLRSIEEHQKACPHPKEEEFLSRCLACGRVRMAKMERIHLRSTACPKHRGSFSCACKEK